MPAKFLKINLLSMVGRQSITISDMSGHNPDYKSIAEHCNLWRNYDDIYDSWDSVLGIINYYGEDKDGFGQYAGPGHWNDPDMLIIGNYGLSLDQSRQL